ncbi:MAG: hypothetical protein RL339_2489, partial [Pseudomonadota bacterium]
AQPPRYTLEQRSLGPDSPALRAAAQAALASRKPGAEPALAGQPIPLPGRLESAPAFDIASAFGDEFAAALDKAPVGQWSGPVLSGFGLHLVKVERREAPPPPKLADIRQQLENDWRSAAVRKAEEDNLNALLKGYDVVIERPE